ncbi:MAG: glycosyltransferase family 4 protein [Bacteroidales bacterium]|nr:glycosyltransferase family 4 protein [Bacteroidales bacterium]
MIRIGFDAKRAFYNYSGLGNYSRNIIKSLYQSFTENEYHLYTPSTRKAISFISGEKVFIHTPDKPSGKVFKGYWRSFMLTSQLRKQGINIFHGLSNELPSRINENNIRSIVTIHDLIFIRYPDLYKPVDREIYLKKFKYAASVADKIIAVSTQTKNDLINFFKVDKTKIEVIYQGCDEIFKRFVIDSKKEEIREKYNLPSEFILYVGTIEERKNLLNVVKALHLGKIDIPLVIIGKTTKYLKKVVNYICNNLVENTIFLQAVPLEDLPVIYQSATLFIYPSVFEGFGIPILEALQSKTPVITSKGGCFEEVGGKGSLYIDPMSVDEIINAIKKLLSDTKLREKMKEEGFLHAQSFTNSIIAKQVMNLYQSIL